MNYGDMYLVRYLVSLPLMLCVFYKLLKMIEVIFSLPSFQELRLTFWEQN